MSRLRAVLGDAVPIVRQGSSYHLDGSGVWVDAEAFTTLARRGHQELVAGDLDAAERTLTEALDLWRGCALAEVTPDLRDMILPSLEHIRLLAAENSGAVCCALRSSTGPRGFPSAWRASRWGP